MLLTTKMQKLKEEIKNTNNSTLIVEGVKDKMALQKLGFNNVLDISGKTLDEVVEKLKPNGEPVIILTDFDEEGIEKEKILTKLFYSYNIKTNSFVRKRIKSLFKIHKIEELKSITKLLEDDYYGKTCSINDKIFNRSRVSSRWNDRKTRRDRGDIWPNRRTTWPRP